MMTYTFDRIAEVHEVAIRMPNWLGDNIMVIPAIAALKNVLNGAHFGCYCPANIKPVWEMTGIFDEIVSYSKSFDALMKTISFPLKSDIMFIFPNSFSSAFAAFFAKSKERIGYRGNGRDFFLTIPAGKRRGLHQVDEYYNLVSSEFPPELLVPLIRITKSRDEIIELLALHKFCEADRMMVAIAPGARWGKSKKWSSDSFKILAEKLVRANYNVIVTGLEGEIEPMRECLSMDNVKFVTGSLDKIAYLFSLCKVAIGNDSGLMHLASA
ncbi:MAG: hypothetical protein A2Y62_17240, partial [Candidatus Fischerbacteria bacterium RBG_13_37_8]